MMADGKAVMLLQYAAQVPRDILSLPSAQPSHLSGMAISLFVAAEAISTSIAAARAAWIVSPIVNVTANRTATARRVFLDMITKLSGRIVKCQRRQIPYALSQ